LLVSGAFGVSTNDSDPPDEKLLRLLRENHAMGQSFLWYD